MKDLLKNYLGKKIKLEPEGGGTLTDVTDNYFILKKNVVGGVGTIYVPYTSILKITDYPQRTTIYLNFLEIDEYLDNLGDVFNSY